MPGSCIKKALCEALPISYHIPPHISCVLQAVKVLRVVSRFLYENLEPFLDGFDPVSFSVRSISVSVNIHVSVVGP